MPFRCPTRADVNPMNATTPTLWAIAAVLAATFAFAPASASVDATTASNCDFVQFRNGIPEYHPECLAGSMVEANQSPAQNLSADP